MRYIFLALMIGILGKAQSQENDNVVIDNGSKDSIQVFKPTTNDYQFFTQFSKKEKFDTVFTIDKSYRFTQYNNRDNFGKIQFANIGGGFQNLVFENSTKGDLQLLPTKKSFFLLGIDEVKYYDVKTPTTAFYYHNGVNNGGTLQTTYTQNVGKRFNFAIEYMGLRSEGFYQRDLASSNNAVFSAHYTSKSEKYQFFTHYIHQNVQNEENGGLANLESFISGDSRFNNRRNLTINLANTHSKFSLRRYYFSHIFTPFDAEKYPFKIKHTLYHQANKYDYTQNGSESYYASALLNNYPTNSHKKSDNLSNTISLAFDKERFKAEAGLRYQRISYGAGFPLIINEVEQGSQLKENRLGLVGNLEIKLWDKINLNSHLELSNGKEFGNFIYSQNRVALDWSEDYRLNAHLNFKSSAPSFNYLMNASFYEDYNYKLNFKNQNIVEFGGDIQLKWFDTKLFAHYFRIDNLAYFNENALPEQTNSGVNISQIGGEATFNYGNFHLNTRVLWQNVLNNANVLPLPKLIARANLYYQDKWFKKVAEVQTGVKAYYFTKFASREYFPVLNEFVLPSDAYSIGGRPIADIYFNFKVKRMMIFAEAQHFNTSFMKNKSYAVPFYPISDFRLNLGLVWYLFH